MTKQELESVFYLNRELDMWKIRKRELELDIAPPVKRITCMPFANTNELHSPTEDKAIRLVECTKMIDEKITELNRTISDIEKFVMSLGDSKIRVIIELRCVGCWSWREIAKYIGGDSNEESVRQMYHRFVSELGEN